MSAGILLSPYDIAYGRAYTERQSDVIHTAVLIVEGWGLRVHLPPVGEEVGGARAGYERLLRLALPGSENQR